MYKKSFKTFFIDRKTIEKTHIFSL
jgi:hypothetical protein